MRILFTIPHYVGAQAGDIHGSATDVTARVQSLANCIMALHQTFGRGQGLIFPPGRSIRAANTDEAHHLDVVICTTGEHHLLSRLALSSEFYRHQPTKAKPPLLGFECHAVLRDGLGNYDYYCYVEDDVLVYDPLLFVKLKWFTDWAGNATMSFSTFTRSLFPTAPASSGRSVVSARALRAMKQSPKAPMKRVVVSTLSALENNGFILSPLSDGGA